MPASILVRLAVALFGLVLATGAGLAADPPPVGVAFRLSVERPADGSLTLRWDIAPGDYLYRDRIAVATDDGRPLDAVVPPGEEKDDPNFGPTEIFHAHVEASVPAVSLKGVDRVRVTYQGCAERGICYPPVTRIVAIDTPAAPGDTSATAPDAVPPTVGEQPRVAAGVPDLAGGWLPLLAAFLGFGLLLAFTPCVLPMVPILAGMLSRPGDRPSAARGFALSSVYVLAMACAYAVLGVAAAWSGANLQVALQTPVALVVMAAVFTALALSSFGLFEIALPSRWGAAASNPAGGRFGAVVGAAALGFTAALVVGPCVTPPLAGALLYVGRTGDVARGAAALFALGLGMGLPLVAVATFGAGILPRSGPWLLATRRLFGVGFLAVAAMLVGRVVPAPLALALWAALAVGVGTFAGAFDGLAGPAGAVPRLAKAAGVLAVVYGATLVVGAAAGATDPLRPLAFLADAPARAMSAAAAGPTVTSSKALDAALRNARASGRPALVDFTADWCTACKDMERTVFADPDVGRRLAAAVRIRADVTATNAETAALMRRFDVVGPPTVLVFAAGSASEVADARTVGEVSAGEFLRRLARAGI